MVPSFYRTTLSVALIAGDTTTTEVFVDDSTNLMGETIAFSQWSPFTRGQIVVNPSAIRNGDQAPEIIEFTGFDSVTKGFTGCTRGMSAITDAQDTSLITFHPAGTEVIITWSGYNIDDLLTYVADQIAGEIGTASDSVSGATKISNDMAAKPRAMSTLVREQNTPGLTLKVNPFAIFANEFSVNFAGGNTGTFTAPVSNPRIDLLVYDTTGSALAIRSGAEAGSPSVPTPTSGDIVLCSVYNRVGQTTILDRDTTPNTQGYILKWYEPGLYKTNYVTTQSYPVMAADADQSQTTQDTTTQVGEANATSKKNKLAQSFIPEHPLIRGVTLYKSADTGSFSGTVTISLQADSGGAPSGSALATQTITNAQWLLIPTGVFSVAFSAEYSTTVGSTYWIVIATSTSDTSNHPNIGANSAGGYANGVCKYNNTTDGWVTNGALDLYFKTLEGIISQIPTTGTNGLLPTAVLPYGFVDYDPTNSSTISNSTTETTVYTKLLAENFFKSTTGFRLRGSYDWVSNGSDNTGLNNREIKIKINGTTVATFQDSAPNNTTGNMSGQYYYDAIVLNTAIAAQKSIIFWQVASGILITYNAQSANNIGRVSGIDQTEATSAVDTSGVCVLTVTMANRQTSGNTSFTHRNIILEKIG